MNFIINLLPILLFVLIYLGSGIYFTIQNVPNAFYQLSPLVAILPALIVGWLLHRGTIKQRMQSFITGIGHHDIITMCLIFLLAGAFSSVTKSIGCIDQVVNIALAIIPSQFLLIGIFLTAACISVAIGTSMGTIATLSPLALGLAQQGGFSIVLGAATVVAGAMFGDNLSLISDTTIAAVMSQEADFRKKLKLNFMVALIASVITILLLLYVSESNVIVSINNCSYLLVLPYLFLLMLALSGVDVIVALMLSIIFAGLIGFGHGYSLLNFTSNITQGFASMYEIMVLSMLIGGLSGLIGKELQSISTTINNFIHNYGGRRLAQYCMVSMVSIFDILFANNTIAIIFSGPIAKDIAHEYKIPAYYSAAWLDIFSCVFQGILPYGAQILLVSSIMSISPLAVMGHVYYCYILGIVSIFYIWFNKKI